jgi:hypothetical protein
MVKSLLNKYFAADGYSAKRVALMAIIGSLRESKEVEG